MLELFKNKRILVVAAHPDDELLGQGATIHKLSRTGHECHALILGEGIAARSEDGNKQQWEEELREHKQNIQDAADIIGYESVTTYDFPDNRFDTVALLDIIKVIEKEKERLQPDVIFTHHGGDLNIDHQKVFQAVITACRPMEHEQVKTIITFETPSGTEWRASSDPHKFVRNLYIAVDKEDIAAKCEAMEAYVNERRDWPHPRSAKALEHLGRRYGTIVGKSFAESFQIVRSIQ
jgi:LmbE family N-acetylglucosaminyl deacetylase